MLHFFHKLSIKHKLNAIILTVSAAVLLLSSGILITNEIFSVKRNLSSDLLTLADIMGINASVGLIFDNQQAAEDNLVSLKAKHNIIMAHVFDIEGYIFASYYREGITPATVPNTQLRDFYTDLDPEVLSNIEGALSNIEEALKAAETEEEELSNSEIEEESDSNIEIDENPDQTDFVDEKQVGSEEQGAYFFGENHLHVFKPIILDGEELGSVYIISDMKELDRRLYQYGSVLVVVIFASLILVLLLASKLQRIITTPIYDLLKITTTVSKEKDYSLRAKKLANDEVGHLIDGFNGMLTTIENRIEELVQTRNELVQSEKMASLGRLVAGFAHELNTPIGVAVGTASVLRNKSNFINQLLEQEEVDEDDLVSTLEAIDQAAELTLSNLRRAAGLVSSFKRTAVDQSSEDVRQFEVKSIIKDVINTLHNKFKRTAIEIQLDCPKDFAVYSIPGSLEQILSNLMMNSLIHGFEEGKNDGRIRIAVRLEEKRLHIDYSDTGKGIAPDVLEKIFEPFFTTNRVQGGSGLGMYICYNLVTSQLNGTMTCESSLGKGVLFKMEFPVAINK
ncbi:MAG: ATP-binding protein [Pseudomonadota bacterium]